MGNVLVPILDNLVEEKICVLIIPYVQIAEAFYFWVVISPGLRKT